MAFLQFAAYLIVGGTCFSIDITGFVILRYCGLGVLTASAISFITATITNYLLCCAFVFRSGPVLAERRVAPAIRNRHRRTEPKQRDGLAVGRGSFRSNSLQSSCGAPGTRLELSRAALDRV
jgi:hypothetical protein